MAKKTLTIYLEEDLIQKLKFIALKEQKTLAALLTEILQEYLEKNGG